MASLNHATIIKGFEKLAEDRDSENFFFDFLKTLKFSAATIKRLRMADGNRNVAVLPGDFALAKQIYFHVAHAGENLTAVLRSLVEDERLGKQKIRFFLTTDFETVVAYDHRVDDWTSFAFADLRENYEFFLPLTGLYEKPLAYSAHPADVKACEKMGKLYDVIRAQNHYEKDQLHNLNVFLTRLLFCFFAEDTGIFPVEGQLTKALESLTKSDGSDMTEFFERLFRILDMPPDHPGRHQETALLAAFPYVNGGLFKEKICIPTFNARARNILVECGRLKWKEISPVIFGAMFQSVMDPNARREIGAHYTSEENIFKVINPLFLSELKNELNQILSDKSNHRIRKLKDFQTKLSSLSFLDPACGCGNFLIIAYRELKRLELEAVKVIYSKEKMNRSLFDDWREKISKVSINQFYGIEIEEFPVEIARVSMWLMEHVINVEFASYFGQLFPTIPLKDSANIICNNSLTVDWKKIADLKTLNYIFGNPPFIGAKMMDCKQKQDATNIFGKIKIANSLDYVLAWFFKTSMLISGTHTRAAYVATNSITQGEQVAPVWSNLMGKYNVKIDFAYRTFRWDNGAPNSAKVHCVIIGFSDNLVRSKKVIFDNNSQIVADNINPYLIDANNVFIEKRSLPISNVPKIDYGSMPNDGGNFILTESEYNDIVKTDPKIRKWVKKFVGATEFINGNMRYCLWLKDANKNDIAESRFISERVDNVRRLRLNSTAKPTQEKASCPHLFFYCSHPNGNYLLIPRTSSERRDYIPIGFMGADTVASDACSIVANATLFHFGILTSRLHMVWMRTVCGRLKSDYRYSGAVVYNTFPWPKITDVQRKLIETLAGNVLIAREMHPDMTLADLYDPDKMPDDLRKAHHELDLAVEALYRKRPFENDEDRLHHLFERYEKLVRGKDSAELYDKD